MDGLISNVAALVGVSSASCRRIANGAHRRYKVFTIAKRGGGRRVVAQPAREVKAVQRAVCQLLSENLPVHDSATAYKAGTSIAANAAAHAGAQFLTKLDFSDFFPSISGDLISDLLRRRCEHLTEAEIEFVVDVCTWRPDGRKVLCIGAPSSPLLANAVMFEFDCEAFEAASEMCVSYTRYSDDIALSSMVPDTLRQAETAVRRIIASRPALRVNERKRVAVGRGTSMVITGLTLTNQGGVSVGRSRKRGVRAGVNRYLLGELDEADTLKLKGEVAFVLSIEPEFRGVLVRTYGLRVWTLLPRMVAGG
ncbi:retron St85 family RNA-directed DNA polymerase [Stenotrophomonas maltophilia]|uniref:retron St85 family RNA-directed DNA polymerase n=1 Tax=Stenotrophomonas maltophilia TaxID=40324 RepID=UPI001D0C4F19|nr:retron St85 family RNA-directed DNA polymerase [Stenotrophomonas maltophilia]UXF72560.1 retron St85 family RNA-directed DNA polymerase [Stenotrophomonas maltophilia]